ncbi:MAG: ATP-binding protein [Pseudomonadota bacterium]|uniref:sensor histidine kinase n=1 Tax=Marisediminitalea TaxID=2662254 RepID=UPI0020CDF5DB|nr:ATP-binding protein [Marisediminitalea aggregata]MCP3865967.1 HAMP domain-containing histidine kinase [Aestuariibacter sp.]MEC8228468.1 ATP-binding protein [Pseudomonadota bacterium]MCP4529015.1 HAMP domain-containing histidine kinase [Aestuariibacter sp.]MCP4946481.1 HAMP domain-containing histidine kinase [Aestuariibacter sp.]MCP9478484.1 ATP-binding protein [Marisediminitalea aggregata]
MLQSPSRLSIRNILLWLVLSISGGALLISSVVSNYTQHSRMKDQLEGEVRAIADMIAAASLPTLSVIPLDFEQKAAQTDTLNQLLNSLKNYNDVLNAHIYSINETPTPEMVALYTKSSTTAVESKINDMARYYTARFDGDVFEIIRPINAENQTYGYVYVRTTAEAYNAFVNYSVTVQIATLLLIVIVAFLVAYRFGHVLSSPVQDMVLVLQGVARSRDYASRAKHCDVREYNILIDAINVLLARMQEYVVKQQQSEQQHQELNSRLEEEVGQRTVALKEANTELIQTLEKLHQFQRQIVENEKMASLGDMVAGVAHEVNTPIGLGITASTMMLDRLVVLEQQFSDKTLKASSMKRFIEEGRENLNIIYRNLNRAADLISSFKQVAVDQSSEEARDINVKQLIEETLMSLRPRLKKVTHTIHIECNESLNVVSKAGPINQILINLIMNSLIHAFEGVENGQIDIIAALTDDKKLKIIYRDNGSGIPNSIKKRIFDPFVTTKRGQGGSGLGMHLVFNLVTQALDGNIKLESEPDKGVEFTLSFPVSVKK